MALALREGGERAFDDPVSGLAAPHGSLFGADDIEERRVGRPWAQREYALKFLRSFTANPQGVRLTRLQAELAEAVARFAEDDPNRG